MHARICTHTHRWPLFQTHSPFYRCIWQMCNLYLTLWNAGVRSCAPVCWPRMFLCVLFLLMHQLVVLWHLSPWAHQSSKPCGSLLVPGFSLLEPLVLLTGLSCGDRDKFLLLGSFRSRVLKRWCEIQTWGNPWLKWKGVLAQFRPRSYIMRWSQVTASWCSPCKGSCEQLCEVCF